MYRRCSLYRKSNLDIYFQDLGEFSRKNSGLIIDVRGKKEYQEWHFDGAINIPVWDIKERISVVEHNVNRFIILYCSSGLRSKKAQQILQAQGYKNVYNVIDGFYGWLMD